MAVEPLREYFTFSSERNYIKSFSQDVVEGRFGLFHCYRIHLRAMSEAKAATSECFLVRLVGTRGTPKMAIKGQGSSVILRALPNILKKQDQNSASFEQEQNIGV